MVSRIGLHNLLAANILPAFQSAADAVKAGVGGFFESLLPDADDFPSLGGVLVNVGLWSLPWLCERVATPITR